MIEHILKQAPEGVTEERIEELLKKHEGNIALVLAELWNVEEKCQNVPYNEDSLKWKNIREICHAYEQEMENFMNTQRGKT